MLCSVVLDGPVSASLSYRKNIAQTGLLVRPECNDG